MFYNALLMICWFGAIPLSYMSSPQVQSCDSLMKRAWWKLWDNIIFGGAPYGALRLVHNPARGNLAGLMVHSCAAVSTRQFITVCCVRNLAFLSIFTILCLQINITACWLSGASAFQFSVSARGEASAQEKRLRVEKYAKHYHVVLKKKQKNNPVEKDRKPA